MPGNGCGVARQLGAADLVCRKNKSFSVALRTLVVNPKEIYLCRMVFFLSLLYFLNDDKVNKSVTEASSVNKLTTHTR